MCDIFTCVVYVFTYIRSVVCSHMQCVVCSHVLYIVRSHVQCMMCSHVQDTLHSVYTVSCVNMVYRI